MCVITNNVFWLFDCHFAPNSVFVIFFSFNFAFLVSLILLGLTWHGGGGGGVGILCNYFLANFAIVLFLFFGWRPGFKTFFCFVFCGISDTLRCKSRVKTHCCWRCRRSIFLFSWWWWWWLLSGEEIFALLSSSVFFSHKSTLVLNETTRRNRARAGRRSVFVFYSSLFKNNFIIFLSFFHFLLFSV